MRSLGLGLGFSSKRAVGGISAQVEGLRTGATQNGRTSTNTLKVLGTDSPPTGWTYSAGAKTLTATGVASPLIDWDLRNTRVYMDAGSFCLLISQCISGETIVTGLPDLLNGHHTAIIYALEYITFQGLGTHQGVGAFIGDTKSGTGTDVVAFTINRPSRLRFLDATSDCVKATGSTHPNGMVFEWCYFGPPKNLPSEPLTWDSATTFALDDLIFYGGFYYLSRISGNINNTPPVGKSNTDFWLNLDPHADAVTLAMLAGRVSFRNCLFDWTEQPPGQAVVTRQGTGTNNFIRLVRNTGTDLVVGKLTIENCIAYRGDKPTFLFAAEDGGNANFNGPVQFRNVKMEANQTAAYYSSGSVTHIDNWINVTNIGGTPIAAPGSASTTDISAAPVNTVVPTITGTVATGATLTFAVGTWTGFPEPLYTVTVQRSDDGVSGWTDIADATPRMLYIPVAGDLGKFLRIKVTGENSTLPEAVAYSAATVAVALGYAPVLVSSQGTAQLSCTPGGSASKVEAWFVFTPYDITTPNPSRLLVASAGIDIRYGTTGALFVQVSDSAGTTIYSASSATGVINQGTAYRLYVSYDSVAGAVVIRLNGAAVTMTPTTGPNTAALLRPNRLHTFPYSGANVSRVHLSDLWLAYQPTFVGSSVFENGGAPKDLTGVGSPVVWFGGGQAVSAWNAGTNRGSGSVTVGSGTFAAV